MKNSMEDRFNNLGMAFFITLFFVMVAVFSNNPVKHYNESMQHEFVSEFHTNNLNAISVAAIQLPRFQEHWVSAVDKMSFILHEVNLKLFADNHKITQLINCIQIAELSIKPFFICRFYYHLFSTGSEELPVLS